MFGRKYKSDYLQEKFRLIEAAFKEADDKFTEAEDLRKAESHSGYEKKNYHGEVIATVSEAVATQANRKTRDASIQLGKTMHEVATAIEKEE
jgi:hypothetical protein